MERATVTDAGRIYSVLFPGDIPPELESRFAGAWQALAGEYSEGERREFDSALASSGDLEALELVGRRKKCLPMLVDQVRLMCVLAETRPDHARYFFAARESRSAAFLALGWAGVRTAEKYLKGLYLLRRMDADW
jgi:hypothetical protein